MTRVVIPYILLSDSFLLKHKENCGRGSRGMDPRLFSTVGWDPLAELPNKGVCDIGVCRCGKGIQVFYLWSERALHLKGKTILRCHDQCGPCCKSFVLLDGIISTYGGLLLACRELNIVYQEELIAKIENELGDALLKREVELMMRECP